MIKPCWKWATAIGTHALTAKQLPSIQMRKVTNSAAHAPFSCHDSGHGFVWFRYEPRRDPTPFTRTCASRMAHRLRQTSIIFRQVEILLAHKRSKWTNSEACNSNISIYYAFNVRLSTKSWQPYACLNSQNYHPPHGTPSFMAFPTYKLGCDRHYIPMVSIYFMPINPFIHFPMAHRWSDRLSFFRSSSYAFGFFRTASSPFTNLLVLCPKTAPCPEAAAQATTAAATAAAADQAADHCKAFPKPLRAGFWLAAILTRSERGANEVRNQILGDWPPKSPDKLFGSHTLSHSFQNSKTQELSAVEQKRKPSQAAAAGKS